MSAPYYEDANVTLHAGDCLDVLLTLPDASVDSVVTDPPYGLEFMGKEWDKFAPRDRLNATVWDGRRQAQDGWTDDAAARSGKGGGGPSYRSGSTYKGSKRCTLCGKRAFSGSPCECDEPEWVIEHREEAPSAMLGFQAWCTEWSRELYRVLKPGGYLISAGGSRTFHRMTSGVEDAGFEIRDTIVWHFGSGFPKSRNISADLANFPACSCDVPGQVGTVDTREPTGAVRAGVRTEPGTVPLAGLATDQAVGVGPEVLPAASSRAANVNPVDIDSVGDGLPVMLGSSAVTAGTERQEIPGIIGRVEVDPESLRDQMVSEQTVCAAAVSTGAVPLDDGSCDVGPASPLVFPLTAAPSGVAFTGKPLAVSDGHTVAGTVDSSVAPTAELPGTGGADVNPVSIAPHADHSTAERLQTCSGCGGRRGAIPQGLGTALKPASEFFVVARKPLQGTVAANVLAWGTGALNVDGCRVAGDVPSVPQPDFRHVNGVTTHLDAHARNGEMSSAPAGRWPANVVLDESQAEALDRQSGIEASRPAKAALDGSGTGAGRPVHGEFQWGGIAKNGYSDQGGASRFYFVAKADSAERPRVNGIAHPTVKPVALMRWLVRLVTPPGGTVLEPFAGSGSTVEACLLEGFKCIAIEREADYLPLIVSRLAQGVLDFGQPA